MSVVMASYLLRPVINPILPWDVDETESSRFKRILLTLLAVSLIFSLIIPFLEVAKPDRFRKMSIPPRLVKMVLEQKKTVKPPPVVIPQEEKTPELEKEKVKEPDKIPEKKIDKPKPEKVKTAKEKAKEVATKHITVFDALADLRDPDDMQNLNNNQSLSNDSGEAATVTRALITKTATEKGSGGIQVATASRSSGTGRLAGQNTTKVKSHIGDAVKNTKRKTKSGGLKRSTENIQLAFEKHKSSIFALYHRALRKNPGLRGRVVFRLTILPNGTVSKCSVESSELNDAALLKRLVSRIKRIKFGATGDEVWNDTYLINFLPS